MEEACRIFHLCYCTINMHILQKEQTLAYVCFCALSLTDFKLTLFLAAPYDDRSIRAHVHRTRELLSLSASHSSLSTMLALQHETGQNASANVGGL